MARKKNDGRGRLGGRQKGTPNKVTTDIKKWVSDILDDGRDKFVESLNGLEPQEYVKAFLRLLNFTLPKIAPVKPKEVEPDPFEEFLDKFDDDD